MTTTYQLSEIDHIAKSLVKKFQHQIILFEADMGSGKTTLIKALARQLGVNDITGSPTFSLVNEYEGDSKKIYHFDLYRIEDDSELYDIGFEDYLDQDAFCFIEWPSIAKSFLDDNTHKITLEAIDSQTRQLTLA